MNLTDKYAKEIRQWNWANIKAQAMQNVETDEEGSVGRCFLGSVMALTPYGKFYTPFANGNVELCPICHGAGTVRNHKANADMHHLAVEGAKAARTSALLQYGAFCYGTWPSDLVQNLAALDKQIEATAETRTCHRCAGLGSYEAYQDQCWNEALEKVADENGMYIDVIDDIFACVAVEDSEDSEV